MRFQYRSCKHAPFIESLEQRSLLSSTSLVKDINIGSDSSVNYSTTQKAALGNKLIFAASDDLGEEIWVSDGTDAGTFMLKDINTGPGSSQPFSFTTAGAFVYFTANDGNSFQIWKTDGTNTTKVTNLAAGNNQGSAVFLAYTNGRLYFSEQGAGANGIHPSSLWYTDGSGPGAEHFVKTFTDNINFMGTTPGILYFDFDGELYRSDGTSGGTSPLKDFHPAGSDFLVKGITYNNQYYYSAFLESGNSFGQALVHTSGTTNTTLNFPTFFKSSDPTLFTISGGLLYFVAADTQVHGLQIWSTNGTTLTQMTGLSATTSFRDMIDVNGKLYFSVSIAGGASRLYVMDQGVPIQVNLSSDGGSGAGNFAGAGSTLFFNGLDPQNKARLFESDGNTIKLVTSGDEVADPAGLITVGSNVFFHGDDDTHGFELHVAAPTPTTPVSIRVTASNTDIEEGDSVRFDVRVKGATVKKYYFDYEGTGISIGRSTPYGTHVYAEARGPVYRAVVRAYLTDGRYIGRRVSILVNNSAPTVRLFASTPVTVPYFPVTYVARIKDKGVNDTFTIDWTFADGYKTTTSGKGPGNYSISYYYRRPVTGLTYVGVTDNHGAYDHSSTFTTVQEVTIQKLKLGVQLLIGGLPGKHKIAVKPIAAGVDVLIDGLSATAPVKLVKSIYLIAPETDELIISPLLDSITTVVRSKK